MLSILTSYNNSCKLRSPCQDDILFEKHCTCVGKLGSHSPAAGFQSSWSTQDTLPPTTPRDKNNKVVKHKNCVAAIMSQPQSLFGQGTLPEENVRALDQLRQRLQHMSLSLNILKADLTKTESLPTW